MPKAAQPDMNEARECFLTLFNSQTGPFDPAKVMPWIGQSVRTGEEKTKIPLEKIKNDN